MGRSIQESVERGRGVSGAKGGERAVEELADVRAYDSLNKEGASWVFSDEAGHLDHIVVKQDQFVALGLLVELS